MTHTAANCGFDLGTGPRASLIRDPGAEEVELAGVNAGRGDRWG